MKMSWGEPNSKGGARMKRLFSAKGLTYLLTIATVGLLLGANLKWHG
jgi:hypothetical protein